MGVHAACGGEHDFLAFTTDQANGFAQRHTDFAELDGRFRHFLERRPQGQRRSMHQPEVQIGVRAIAATVDQRWFRRQVRFVDQRIHSQIRQPLSQGQGFRLQVKCVHYQLLNLAGGL